MKQTNPWRYVAILIGMYCITSVAAPIGKDAAKRNAAVFVQSQAKGVRPAQADLNGDGVVDVGDIMAIINIMAPPINPSEGGK